MNQRFNLLERCFHRPAGEGEISSPSPRHTDRFEIWWIEELGAIMGQQTVYELLSAPYPAELSEAVSARLAQGWQLFGHPFSNGGEFYQAIVGKLPDDKRLRKTTGDAPPVEEKQ
jgi:hypothetical protein